LNRALGRQERHAGAHDGGQGACQHLGILVALLHAALPRLGLLAGAQNEGFDILGMMAGRGGDQVAPHAFPLLGKALDESIESGAVHRIQVHEPRRSFERPTLPSFNCPLR
jgi:hypothetical protein